MYIEYRIEERLSSREMFAEEQFRKPEHRHIVIGLRRLNNTLTSLKASWQRTGRHHALNELESALKRQHEIELEIEKVDNMFLREYAHEILDKMAVARQAMVEEVRWDVGAERSLSHTQNSEEGQSF